MSLCKTRAASCRTRKHARRSARQQLSTRSVGLDVHTDAMAVASVAQEHPAAVVSLGTMGPRHCASATRVRRLQAQRKPLVFVSEAGPCGSWLSRSLTTKGQGCWVVAPSLLPKQPGDRGKTHRRDALTLARLRRAGALPPGSVPQGEDAAMRDLGRARDEASRARKAAPLRLQALLLRQASRAPGPAPWSPAPLRWRSAVVCPTPAPPMVLQADVRAVTAPTARLERVEPARKDPGPPWRRRPVGDALQARRGVPVTVAVTAGAALGALTRCATPRQLRRALGLTPSAYAPGARRRQGGIPTAGQSHARRALLDGAWASRSPAPVRRPLHLRLEQVATPLQDRRWQAQGRLGTRDRPVRARGKNATQGGVAIARELRACRWAMAQAGALTPEPETVASPASVLTRL